MTRCRMTGTGLFKRTAYDLLTIGLPVSENRVGWVESARRGAAGHAGPDTFRAGGCLSRGEQTLMRLAWIRRLVCWVWGGMTWEGASVLG